jgi:hypothetical protein
LQEITTANECETVSESDIRTIPFFCNFNMVRLARETRLKNLKILSKSRVQYYVGEPLKVAEQILASTSLRTLRPHSCSRPMFTTLSCGWEATPRVVRVILLCLIGCLVYSSGARAGSMEQLSSLLYSEPNFGLHKSRCGNIPSRLTR